MLRRRWRLWQPHSPAPDADSEPAHTYSPHSLLFRMLAQIAPLITRGIVDNTSPGYIELKLWGIDGGEPIEFLITGNCLPDIAGCRVSFTNNFPLPAPEKEHPVLRGLREETRAVLAGDMTLSRRVPEQDNRRALSNALSIEFFLLPETRVLLELSNFSFDISLPQWEMSWSEANAQMFLNMEALRSHVEWNMEHFVGPGMADLRNTDFPACEWDALLNRAEAAMAIFPTIREKYRYEENGYNSLAYVMGRMDILAQKAAEDEAQMPPDPQEPAREWEVVDFVDAAHADEVKRALHHPLFAETSHLTAIINQTLMRAASNPPSEEIETFINQYAALVSHILATILLSRQKKFELGRACKRVAIIMQRVQGLAGRGSKLMKNPQSAAMLQEASASLLSRLEDFDTRLRHL